MRDSEVLFALLLLRAPRNFLRHFLNLPKTMKIAIESFKNSISAEINSVVRRGYWSEKNPAECHILRDKLMFGIFSNTIKNEHAEKIGIGYDVDRIRTHGIMIDKFKPRDVFPIIRDIYSIR